MRNTKFQHVFWVCIVVVTTLLTSCATENLTIQPATLNVEDRNGIVESHSVSCDVLYIPKTFTWRVHLYNRFYTEEMAIVPFLFVLDELGFSIEKTNDDEMVITVFEKIFHMSMSNATIILEGYDSEVNYLQPALGIQTPYIQPKQDDLWVDLGTLCTTVENLTGRRMGWKIDRLQSTITLIWLT